LVSALVLTKNEERELPGCLESLSWCDDVHVFDSFSTDSTVSIARAAGAHVTQRHFDNWAAHQNWALENIPFRHSWVFYIDADERVTPTLVESINRAVESTQCVAYQVQRRDFMNGKWLRHVQATPYYLRLFLLGKMRYARLVNPVSLADGPVGVLPGYLDHFPFAKGVSHWVERHNAYSTLEAQQTTLDERDGNDFSVTAALFSRDITVRRYNQKRIFNRLPCRPMLRFLLLYGYKRGFLDGREGFTYAVLQAFYEYMIGLKKSEHQRELAGESRLTVASDPKES
jgi:glycosyltransferase involved in cell wall biosynthesis